VIDHRLAYESHVASLTSECEIIYDAGDEAPDALVPTCPEWKVSDLVAHLGDVFTFWRAQLEAASSDVRTERDSAGARSGSDLMGWYEEAATKLQQVLLDRDPAEPCWNWSGADLTARWVGRRMALESAVHRYDAVLAVGSPAGIEREPAVDGVERELAVDGIDEWLAVHLATDLPEMPEASLGGVLCLACADDPAAWTVEVEGGRLRWREGRGPADAVVVGSASDLYLFSWNRRPLEALELTGRRDVAEAWSSIAS